VTATFNANPDTAWLVSIGEAPVAAPGLGTIPFVGYDGQSQRLGYAVIRGRWSTAPGEAVAPTNVFTQAGLAVDDRITLTHEGKTVTVRLVGEIFDVAQENPDDLVIRGSWTDLAALQPGVSPSRWEAASRDGVAPRSYVSALQAALELTANVYLEGDTSSDTSFLIFLSTVATLGAVLVAVSIGGVFNTVLLETRQRTHELAVLKALGLTPVEVIWMVVMSVVPVALLAGLVGVPLGLAAQRLVLQYMGHVAASLDIPAAVFDVFPIATLALLALAGVAIGAIGAFVPAQRAARAPIAPVLQAE
jgi:putative ABC transport system permease protein